MKPKDLLYPVIVLIGAVFKVLFVFGVSALLLVALIKGL